MYAQIIETQSFDVWLVNWSCDYLSSFYFVHVLKRCIRCGLKIPSHLFTFASLINSKVTNRTFRKSSFKLHACNKRRNKLPKQTNIFGMACLNFVYRYSFSTERTFERGPSIFVILALAFNGIRASRTVESSLTFSVFAIVFYTRVHAQHRAI